VTLKALFRRNRLDSEMNDEIRFHLESRTEDLVRQGMTLRQASRQARLEFGPAAAHKDSIRAALGLRWLDELVADLAYAARILRKSPGFTLIAVASLALAIGANTVIFSFTNQMLFVHLGVPRPAELRMMSITLDKHSAIHDEWGNFYPEDGVSHTTSFSYPVYRQLRSQSTQVLNPIFGFKDLGTTNLAANGPPQVVKTDLVSGNFYAQMELHPVLGRPIVDSDDGAPGTGAVAVISNGLWHRAFGGSPDVIGKTVSINAQPVTIVGVNPPEFNGPDSSIAPAPGLYMPLSMISVLHPSNGRNDPFGPDMWWLEIMARAKPGISDAKALAALNVQLEAAVRGTMKVNKDETIPHLQLFDGSHGDTSEAHFLSNPVYILLGLAGLVLLLACANIANLMLARASIRQREMSVRMALGAGRWRILRQVLTESLLVAFMGGAAGLFLGYLGRNLLPWLRSVSWRGGELTVAFDWRVFGFTAAVTLVTGVLFGLLPAWRSTRGEINTALKEGSRSATRQRKTWSGKAIVGFQVALSTLLVMSALFFLRTLINLNSVKTGFEPQGLLLFDVTPPHSRYPPPQDVALHQRFEQAFAAIPGVQGVTATNVPLVAGNMWNSGFHVEGAPETKSTDRDDNHEISDLSDVGTSFFSVMKIPILAGRAFTPQDTETSVRVSVVNQALAKQFFPGVNPIGKRFRMGHSDTEPDEWYEVVGICADTQYNDMNEAPPPVHFDLYRQMKEADGVTYLIRSSLPPSALIPSLRRVAQRIDPDLPLANIRTEPQQIAASMQQETMFASLTTGFGVLALALACVGIYGIMAYTVSQRTNEIGIRLALGAVRNQIRAMILRETGWLAAAGVLVGLASTLALIRLIKSMLYGLTPYDPLTLAAGTLLLLLMALIAGWIPATRASRVEPMEALRHD
jgi:predicted permease